MSTSVPAEQKQGVLPLQYPLLLKSLPTPKEVTEVAEWFCRYYGFKGRAAAETEEQVKLQYYFGDKTIPAVDSRHGLLILAPELPKPEIVHTLITEYKKKGQMVILLHPCPWENEGTDCLSPLSME